MPVQSRRGLAAPVAVMRNQVITRSLRFVSSSAGGNLSEPDSRGSRLLHNSNSFASAGSVICTTPGLLNTSVSESESSTWYWATR